MRWGKLGALILTQHIFHVADTKRHEATGSPCYTGDHRLLTAYPPNRQAQASPAGPHAHLEHLLEEKELQDV